MSVSVRSVCEGIAGTDSLALWGEGLRPMLAVNPLFGFSGTFAAAGVPSSALLATVIVGSVGLLCAFLRFPAFFRPANLPGSSDHQRLFLRLLADSRQSLVALALDQQKPLSLGGGSDMLMQCLTGPDSARLAAAIDSLLATGAGFEIVANLPDARRIAVRGTPVGSRAVLYFRDRTAEDRRASGQTARTSSGAIENALRLSRQSLKQLVEGLSVGIAIFDDAGRLAVYNRSYARMWDFPESYLDAQPSESELLDRLRDSRQLPEQRDFAAWKREQLAVPQAAAQEEFWHLPQGRSLRIVKQPHLRGGKLAVFEDISEKLFLQTSLNLLLQVQKATLDTLDEGVAIFGPEGRLLLHNAHFSALWRLTEEELASQPHHSDIARFCAARLGHDETWDVIAASVSEITTDPGVKWRKAQRPDGRIIALSLSRLPNGATIATFSDVTDLERFTAMQNEDRDAKPSADLAG
jgi:PAS domain-containing protein